MRFSARLLVIVAVMIAICVVGCSHGTNGGGTATQNNSVANSGAGSATNANGGTAAANANVGAMVAAGANVLPGGFQSSTDADGTGTLLWAKAATGQTSAKGAMRDALGALKNYFDAAPQFASAVSDSADQVVQVMLSANFKGQPVNGIATAVIGSAGGVFGLVYDRPASLKSSFANLSKQFSAQLPKSASSGQPFSLAAPASWTRQTGGDKSGAVNLPAGWKVTGCVQGNMQVVGPRGEYVQLGNVAFVNTQLVPGTTGLASPYLAPVPAFTFFTNYVTKVNRATGVNLINVPGKVIESKAVPAPMQGGEGAFMLQEMTVNGTSYKVYALVYTAKLLLSGWQFYTSYVAAPSSVFAGEFGDMMRIWNSWKVDDAVYQQMMAQTLQTMQSTSAMINNSTQQEIGSFDNLQANMENIINGEDEVQNNTTGTRANVPMKSTSTVIQGCKNSGYDCQVVPFSQLAGGH
jgi:hypothetical protein